MSVSRGEIVLVDYPFLLTYDQRLIIATIGRLSGPMMKQVNDCLRKALDL